MNYQAYILSDFWQFQRRYKLMECDKCEKCGRRHELDVHHKTYERLGDELMSDLIVLCVRCHNDLHYYENLIPATEKMILRQTAITQAEFEERKRIVA